MRKRIKQAESNVGEREGPTTEEREESGRPWPPRREAKRGPVGLFRLVDAEKARFAVSSLRCIAAA